ncbi:MAG: heavy-metal-associated domain-containing protein [Cyanobacteria bacterium P01_G01_bin.39]
MTTIELQVPNMAWGACGETITTAIIDLDSKASVKADPKTKQVIVTTQASESSVKEALIGSGYPAA